MSVDPVLLSILLIVVVCIISFVVTRAMSKRTAAVDDNTVIELLARISLLEQQQASDASRYEALKEQLSLSEAEKGKVEIELRLNTERRVELEGSLSELRQSLQSVSELHISAEKTEQIAQAKLSERTGALKEQATTLTGLEQKLSELNQELVAERRAAAEISNQSKSFEIKAQEESQKCVELKQSLSENITRYDTLNEKYNSLNTEHAEMTTTIKEREHNLQQQLAQFEEQKESLSTHFKSLANDVLEAKSKTFQQTSQQSIGVLMDPFKNSMDAFKKEVQEIHHRDGLQQGQLKKELEGLRDLNSKLSEEAHELSTALRGQKKLQGNWGELVLENVLDRSGLQLGKDYKREVSFNTEEGRLRPDVVVDLPQGKNLVIDSKVSLNAYTRFVNSDDESVRAIAIKEHVKAVGDRINELADKEYGKLPGLNSPEMVFMFVPIESAFVEALKADESLFQRAIEKNVLVATPTTLLTSLNIVRQLWRFEDQNKHTALLASKAEQVFKKLNTFLQSFSQVKKGLDKAGEAYTKAENQLLGGKGNLVKQVNEFKKLAPTIKDELPEYFQEKAELGIDLVGLDEDVSESDQVIDQSEPILIDDKTVVSETQLKKEEQQIDLLAASD